MNTLETTVRNWRLAFLFWFLWLTAATHLPQEPPAGDEPFFESPDKLLHFLCFGLLAFLFAQTRFVKNSWWCWLIIALWAVFDELAQHLLPIQREFSTGDLLSGELGIAAFIVWNGALSGDAVSNIRTSVEATLSKTKNWLILGLIGFGVGFITMALIWFSYKTLTGKQYSQVAFVDATLITMGCVLWFFVRKGEMQEEVKQLVKSMLPSIFLTILIAVMIGGAATFTTLDPWVAAMAALVAGLRIAWNRNT